MKARTSLPESDEEVIKKIDEILKDPEKYTDHIASNLDRAVKHWRKR